MADIRETMTKLEKDALMMASFITAYSPHSLIANESPTGFAMLYSHARIVMIDAGIEPHENIQCWFWQIQKLYGAKDANKRIKEYAKLFSPRLVNMLGWEHPVTGRRLNDVTFRALWSNNRPPYNA